MKFEMTKCNQCGSEMLMGLDTCPSCGKQQSRRWGAGSLQPRVMVAAGLTAAVLFAFNWFKQPTPHATQVTSPPSVSVPSR
jgi:hypothetical protein